MKKNELIFALKALFSHIIESKFSDVTDVELWMETGFVLLTVSTIVLLMYYTLNCSISDFQSIPYD